MLRPIHSNDLEAYFELLQDPDVLRLTGTQTTFTRQQVAGWIASLPEHTNRIDLAVILRNTGELIGEIVLNEIDTTNRSANIRIAVRSSHTNHGYGSEAMRLVLAYAFEELHLHRIELEVFAFNPRARHVYDKLGFQQEGRRREVLYMDGVYYDAIDMSILEHEYREAMASP